MNTRKSLTQFHGRDFSKGNKYFISKYFDQLTNRFVLKLYLFGEIKEQFIFPILWSNIS